jgi:hypothetical protein
VGRIVTRKRHQIISITLGWVSLCLFAPVVSTAQAFTAVAQTTPAITRSAPLARDASTFEIDKALNAACRKSGQPNSAITRETCLCVTHILKYELTLPDYRVAARIYGASGDRTQLYTTLRREGASSAQLAFAEGLERDLILSSNFRERCATAKAYYK